MGQVESHSSLISKRAQIAGSVALAASAIAAWGCSSEANNTSSGLPVYEDNIGFVTPPQTTIEPRPLPTTKAASNEVPDHIIEGKLAPEIELSDVNGNQVDLDIYKGKVVILFVKLGAFPQQGKVMENWKNIERSYSGEVIFVTLIDPINSDSFDISSVSSSPVLAIDDVEDFSSKYMLYGYPTEYIVDRDGKYVGRNDGKNPDAQFLDMLNNTVAQ